MILSRLPIVSSRNHMLPKYGTLTQHSIQQGALEAVIVTERAGPVRIYSIHLSHLSPATRLPQVEALLDIHTRAPSEGGAWCGGHPEPEAGWTEGEMPPMPADAILLGRFQFRKGCARIRSHRRTCDDAIWSPQSLDRIRRRVGRSRTSGGRRRDDSRGEADRLLPGFRDARASRAVVVDRRQRNRIRSLSALDGNRSVSRERRWLRGPQMKGSECPRYKML